MWITPYSKKDVQFLGSSWDIVAMRLHPRSRTGSQVHVRLWSFDLKTADDHICGDLGWPWIRRQNHTRVPHWRLRGPSPRKQGHFILSLTENTTGHCANTYGTGQSHTDATFPPFPGAKASFSHWTSMFSGSQGLACVCCLYHPHVLQCQRSLDWQHGLNRVWSRYFDLFSPTFAGLLWISVMFCFYWVLPVFSSAKTS